MKYSSRHYAQALLEVAEESDKSSLDTVVDNFLSYLRRTGDIKNISAILRSLDDIYKTKYGIVDVSVTTARDIGTDTVKHISDMILKKMNVDYKTISLKDKIDENIIGGAIIEFEDKLVDISSVNVLNQIKQKILFD